MTKQRTDEPSGRVIELTEGDLEQVTGGAISNSALRLPVREDPDMGGEVMIRSR